MRLKKMLAVSVVVAMLLSLAIVPAHAVAPTENSDIEIVFAPASLVLVAGDTRVREVEIIVTQDGEALTLTAQHAFTFTLNFPTQILDTEIDVVPGVAFDPDFSGSQASGQFTVNSVPGELTPTAPMATLEIGPLAHTGAATGNITITDYDLSLLVNPFWSVPGANFAVASLPVTFVDAVTALPTQPAVTGTVVSEDATTIDLPGTIRVNFTADVSAEFAVIWNPTDIDDAADGNIGDAYAVVGTLDAMDPATILPAGFPVTSIDDASAPATITAQVTVTPPGTRMFVANSLEDVVAPDAVEVADLDDAWVAALIADMDTNAVGTTALTWMRPMGETGTTQGDIPSVSTDVELDWASFTPVATLPTTIGQHRIGTVGIAASVVIEGLAATATVGVYVNVVPADGYWVFMAPAAAVNNRNVGRRAILEIMVGGDASLLTEADVTINGNAVAAPAIVTISGNLITISLDNAFPAGSSNTIAIVGWDPADHATFSHSTPGTSGGFPIDGSPVEGGERPVVCDECGELEEDCECDYDNGGGYTGIFTDLGSVPWARHAIETLATMGVVTGVSANTFNPNGQVTRQEFAAMLMRLLEYMDDEFEVGGANNPFGDVATWAADYVASAFEVGAVLGFSDTYFGANYNITRAHLALMLFRVFGEDLDSATLASFVDESSIPDYALDAVIALARAGIITGVPAAGGFAFNPSANATRAEAATMLFRVYEALNGDFEVDAD